MSIEATTGYALLGTQVACDVVALLLVLQYHRRREFQPIRSRFYWQGEATALLLLFPMLFSASASEFEPYISCDVYLLMVLFMFNAVVPIIIRAAHVYSAYEVSKVYAQDGSSNAEEEAIRTGNFFLRRAEILQSFRTQVLIFLGLCGFHLLVWVVYTQAFQSTCNGIDELIGIGIFGMFYSAITFYIGWNIATLKDGLYIRRELIWVAAGGLVLVPTFVALRFVFNTYYYANIAVAFLPFWVILVQIGMPLYKSYSWQRLRQAGHSREISSYDLSLTNAKSSERIVGDSFSETHPEVKKPPSRSQAELKGILGSAQGYQVFLEFCRLELNHENAMFYNEATPILARLKADPEFAKDEEFIAVAWRIYARYIAYDSKLEINMSAHQRRLFESAGFGEANGELDAAAVIIALQEAWKNVFSLMYNDIYPRFLKSALYETFREEAA